jgi:hypothetical protein
VGSRARLARADRHISVRSELMLYMIHPAAARWRRLSRGHSLVP